MLVWAPGLRRAAFEARQRLCEYLLQGQWGEGSFSAEFYARGNSVNLVPKPVSQNRCFLAVVNLSGTMTVRVNIIPPLFKLTFL